MPIKSFQIGSPFDLKLEQLKSQEKDAIGSIFITFNTLKKICKKERVLAGSLPLAALQRKIGESGRFYLPDKGIIDDVFDFTLNDYSRQGNVTHDSENKGFLPFMVVKWLKQGDRVKEANEVSSSESSEVESREEDSNKASLGPMKEKDWDYVFQANKILSCSYVDPLTSQVLRASHAAFRLRTSNEDDAEPDLPQDDERAKIPVWTLSKDPSRTYIHETNSELETSAMMSGHSKKSLEVGLSGAYKAVSAEVNYGRTTEKAYEDTNTYGKKESNMSTVYEIPIVELSLDKGNSRISDACRQALLKLRDERSFSDLMDFFGKYGTMYSKKVVLGGRLVGNERFFEETMEETKSRQIGARNNASLSVGIDPFSVKGSYSDEHGTKTKDQKKETANQKDIDWTAIGGNAGFASNPEKWLPTVSEYRYWKIVQNIEVVSIQDFIGSLPGYDDIPGLFQEILDGGLYSPESLHLGPRPVLPGQKKPTVKEATDDGLDVAPLGAGIDTRTLAPAASKQTALASSTLQYETSRTKAKGGCSWQVLDTPDAVKLEIASTLQSLTNTGANRLVIPKHLYSLSLEPETISLVLQWSSDLVEKGLNLGSPSAAQAVKKYTTLNQLASQQCSEVLKAASELKIEVVKDDKGVETSKVVDKDGLIGKIGQIVGSNQNSSLAALKVAAWKEYFDARLRAVEDIKPGEVQQGLLDSIKTAIFSMPDEDMGQQSSTMVPFDVTDATLKLLKGQDKGAFVTSLGHQLLESYTEKASLSAVWNLQIPKTPKNNSTSTQEGLNGGKQEDRQTAFYDLRMRLQKYFLTPRTVSEVCSFLSAPEDSFDDIQTIPRVTVSIFGYRDEFTKDLVELNDKSPSLAAHYLTQDALFRNRNKVTITMRPWQGLHIKGFTPPDNHLGGQIPPVAPEEFFVLNTQKAQRLLLLLKMYSEVSSSNVKPNDLPRFGEKLDTILDPKSFEGETGNMLPNPRASLAQLVRDLEKLLPDSDLENIKEALKAADKVKNEHKK